MPLVKWEPFGEIASLRKEIDRLFEDFFGGAPLRGEMLEPAVEVAETDQEIVVKAQVPGASKEQLQVNITDTTLTLKGKIKKRAMSHGSE